VTIRKAKSTDKAPLNFANCQSLIFFTLCLRPGNRPEY